MVRKMYLRRTLISSIIFCILPLYMVVTFREKEINTVIRVSMGGEVYSPLTMVYIILIFFTPTILFLFLFSDFFSSDFEAMEVYVFTRAGNPFKYLMRKTLYLIGCVFGYTVINTALCFVISGLAGGLSETDFKTAAGSVLMFFLNSLMLAGLVSTLSMAVKSHYSFLLISVLYMLSVLTGVYLPENIQGVLVKINPFLQGFYAWHDNPPVAGLLQPSVWISVIYMAAVLFLDFFLFYQYVKRCDFI